MSGGLLSKYVMPGDKVDIRTIKREDDIIGGRPAKIYQSQIYDLLSEERIEIIMPMEKTKIVLLPIGMEYDLFFYSSGGLYQCRAKIVDRDKKDSTYLLVMDLISNLRKDQRREYYRFSCALEMNSRALEREEVQALEENGISEDMVIPGLPLKRSIIVDISGGGLRFVADYGYEQGSILLCKYQLETDEGPKVYEILGKVLSVKEIENRSGAYEHRVQYIKIDNDARENIIKFIFEEERKNLKKKN